MSGSKKPNVVVIITDDQGYGDLSCMGATDFVTPNLDRLAAEGTRFTNWYSNSPVCSPARASLLTGKYPGNTGVRSILAGHRTAPGLSPSVPMLQEVLGENGYNTYMAGKWHLGTVPQCRPEGRKFDHWYGHLAGCIDYFSHVFYWAMNKNGNAQTHDLWEDGKEVYDNGKYFTEMVTEKSLDYIRHSCKEEKPFFLYVAYNAPHYPMHAPKKYVDRFPHLSPDRRIMAAMLSAVDDGVGDITDELQRQGISDDTIILFVSDNGPSRENRNWMDGNPDPYYGGTTGGLKGHKFSLYDGGLKVPCIVKYPRAVKAGQVVDEMGSTMDAMPTLLCYAGIDGADYSFDGKDLSTLLEGKEKALPERTVFWEQGNQLAARRGKWKLVLNGVLVEGADPEDAVHLADVVADPSESVNLASENPQIVEELTQEVRQWIDGIERITKEVFVPEANGLVTHA